MSSEWTKKPLTQYYLRYRYVMSELDKDGHTPVVIRKTTEEVMKEQGKGWYLICFQGLKKSPGHWPHPTAKE